MRERGFISAAALWLALIVSSLAWSALAQARWAARGTRGRLDDARVLYAVNVVFQTAVADDFRWDRTVRSIEGGEVSAERIFLQEKTALRLSCDVRLAGTTRRVDITLQKHGGEWRVARWSEGA